MATPRLVAAMKRDIGIRVLGPVEARATTGWLTAPPQQRLLLALLALQVGQVIPVGELIDAIWPEAPPTSARASIQVMISRLRQILAGLPGGAVERCGDGYRLVVEPSSIDVQQFRMLTRAARGAPNASESVDAFDQALALWRGPAMADVPGTARTEAIQFALGEERLSAMQDRISALLGIGRDWQAAEELTGLMAAHPLSERLAGLLMVALHRGGRQADALQVFRDLRKRLSAELAIEPGRDLQHLHQQILAGDPELPGTTGGLITSVAPPGRGVPPAAAGDDSHPIPRQLPTGVAHFTGRTAEVNVLDRLLEQVGSADGTVAIATISGTAGVGKTSLALHWAHHVAHKFPDGQLYVDLRAFGPSRGPVRPAEAIRGFLDALNAPKDSRPADTEVQAALYRSMLARKRMLVVLDNAADEDQVRPLLPGGDGCLVVVTSRRRLAGLCAREGAMLLTLDVLSQPEAVELLEKRLGVQVTAAAPDTANQLATLCGRLPLALSIAAVRAAESRSMDLAALAGHLQDAQGRLDVLDAGERLTSVRAVLSWSYQGLSEPAARMFRLLGVHPGPDIGLAAAASLIGRPVVQTSRILAELVSAHVLTEHAPGRWVFNDLLRAYANDQARRDEYRAEQNAATQRVLDYYIHTAWSASLMLAPVNDAAFPLGALGAGVEPERISDETHARAWYAAEYSVLLTATSWAAARGFDGYAWRLTWALKDYLAMLGHSQDVAVTMETALAAAVRAGDMAGQARAHHGLGCSAHWTLWPPKPESASHLRQALRLYRDLDDGSGQALAHTSLGILFHQQGRTQAALRETEEALLLARASGDRRHEASALNQIGWMHAGIGHYELARTRCQQALVVLRADRDRFLEACTLDSIGYVSHKLGHYAQADECYRQALQLFGDVSWFGARAEVLDHIGDNCAAAAQPTAAQNSWQQALAILDGLEGADTSGIRQKLSA
jgi:DNA-binding SARP family transcriptional activator/tetratricopeptide (TPR) repeat protein